MCLSPLSVCVWEMCVCEWEMCVCVRVGGVCVGGMCVWLGMGLDLWLGNPLCHWELHRLDPALHRGIQTEFSAVC